MERTIRTRAGKRWDGPRTYVIIVGCFLLHPKKQAGRCAQDPKDGPDNARRAVRT